MKKAILSGFCFFFLTGCISPYVPSESGPKAKLRLATSSIVDRTDFYVVNKTACPTPEYYRLADMEVLSIGEKSDLHMLGQNPDERQFSSRERIIDAEKPIYIYAIKSRDATQYAGGYSCKVGGVFFPKTDAQYEITYTLDSNRCRLDFMSLVPLDGNKVNRIPEPTARPIPAYDIRNFCNY